MYLTTSCKTKAILASVVNRVPEPSSLARTSVLEDGGGNRPTIESADCTKSNKRMKNLIINILEAAAFLLLGLGVSLLK